MNCQTVFCIQTLANRVCHDGLEPSILFELFCGTDLDYVENIVKSRTLSTRKQYSEESTFHIPEEFDEQKFKNRMWYVGYQKIQNSEEPWETRSWKKQSWKNPLYIDELAFGEGYNSEFGQLNYKYYELWRCVYHGIRKF